ncbi:MAG: hypothetical protein ACI9P5_004434, partial [Saprospiraceae bacterium]
YFSFITRREVHVLFAPNQVLDVVVFTGHLSRVQFLTNH